MDAAIFDIYSIPIELHPFIFVGCWNSKGRPRDAVIKAITESPIENVVLGGDNFYPEKKKNATGKKVKKYNSSLLTTPIFAKKQHVITALGNHNIDVGPDKNGQIVDILDLEKAYQKWNIPGGPPYFFIMRYKDVDLMILDTNIITIANDPDVKKEERDAAVTAVKHMLECIEAYVPPPNGYYCVMHEPIFSAQQKRDDDNKITSSYQQLTMGKELLKALCNKVPPISILCADTHNYHDVLITYRCPAGNERTIRQIVVGTGGAKPDKIDWSFYKAPIIADDIKYEIIPPNITDSFGYMIITKDINTFIGVPIAGGRRQTRKRDGRRRRSKRRQ